MLAPALRRYVDRRPFENFQQRLLHPFARYVARDRRVVALAGDLVDLVDEDDAALGLLDVVVGDLQQPRENALDILAHISRLGQNGRVDDRERHFQQLGDRAMSVLPVPVGPTSTTFDLSISISPSASADFERMRL